MAELVVRLRETADGDLRELARDLRVGVTVDERDLEPWADLMDEAADRISAVEATLATERQTATLNAETHTRAIRALQDTVEAEAEARREAEGEVERLRDENARLRIAFHDATRRPLGVTPDSGTEFYNPLMADEAEARRADLAQRDRDRRSDEIWHYLF